VEATALAADNCVNCGGLTEDIPTGDSTPKPAVGSDPADVSRGTWKEGGLSELDIVVILLQVRGDGQVFFIPVMSTTEAWSCCTSAPGSGWVAEEAGKCAQHTPKFRSN